MYWSVLLVLATLAVICLSKNELNWRKNYKKCVFSSSNSSECVDEDCLKSYIHNSNDIQDANKMTIHWEHSKINSRSSNYCSDKTKRIHHTKYIVDLRCYYRWPDNTFHQIYDCFLPNIPLLLTIFELPINDTYLILPKGYEKYYLAVLPDIWTSRYLDNNDCVVMNESNNDSNGLTVFSSIGVDIVSPTHYFSVYPQQFKWNVRKMREIIFKKYRIKPAPKRIIFIEREGVRSFDPSVKQTLQMYFNESLPNVPVVSFYGNETMIETINLFSSAQVIIYFHGAGIGNIIYAPDHVILVELSIFVDPSFYGKSNTSPSVYLWRSGVIKPFITDYTPLAVEYFRYGIPGDNQLQHARNIDAYLHREVTGIVIPDTDLWNIKDLVTTAVQYNKKNVITKKRSNLAVKSRERKRGKRKRRTAMYKKKRKVRIKKLTMNQK